MTKKSTDHQRKYKSGKTFYDFVDSQNGMTVNSLNMLSFLDDRDLWFSFKLYHKPGGNGLTHGVSHTPYNEPFTVNINLSPGLQTNFKNKFYKNFENELLSWKEKIYGNQNSEGIIPWTDQISVSFAQRYNPNWKKLYKTNRCFMKKTL